MALPDASRLPLPAPRLIVDAQGLDALVGELDGVERYGFDTEFHRERTYWPKVALVQLSWSPDGERTEVALVDPLAVDISALAPVFEGPATMIAHAAEQDLEILRVVCHAGPSRLFDTQIAAGFAGYGSASLAALASGYLGRDVPKGDRLTDWSARPLSASQLRYAAADVVYLLELADAITADLDRRGRREWAVEECELVRRRPHGQPDSTRAWWKLRDARQLKGTSRGVAQEVAAWREARAQTIDIPLRHVLPDLAVQAIAHRPPSNRAELAATRGLEARYLRNDIVPELLAAVERGKRLPADVVSSPPADEVPRELRPAIALAMAWVAQLARDEGIDAASLATRSDLVAFLQGKGSERGRLGEGWRAGLVGRPLRRLVEGDAALAFDGRGGLVVEERSHRPLGT